MTKQCCANCIYAHWNRRSWLRTLGAAFPTRPLCANHPDEPGQLREVAPGGLCRNYRAKPAATEGDIKRIPLGGNQYALVDAADYEWLSKYHWRLQGGYPARREKGKTILMHREIMQAPKGKMVDHINHNRVDNCRVNLRICTRQQNTHNNCKHIDSSSRFKGVGYSSQRHKWFSKTWFEGQRIWLGYFTDEVEAAHTYDHKAVELFGEFAYLNFPEEWPPEKKQQVYAAAQPLRDALKAKTAQTKAEKGKGGKGRSRKAKGRSTTPHKKTLARKGRTRPNHDAKRKMERTKRNARKTTPPERKQGGQARRQR